MTNFSRRYKYNPKVPKEAILEDAPYGLRLAFVNGVLDDLTFIDDPDYVGNPEGRPLEVKHLHREFCLTLREEPSWGIGGYWKALIDLLYSVQWYEFYDFVELVGAKLIKVQENHILEFEWLEWFGYEAYRTKVNKLFAEDGIGWRLNAKGQLTREVHPTLSKRLETADKALSDGFEPARQHFGKAMRYAYERPIDPENSIKEVVSAIESLGRKLYPGTSTLGDVVKEMRKSTSIPAQLTTMIDKFYGFASSAPAVRHGAPEVSTVDVAEAEFCLHVGAALIRYLIEKSKQPPHWLE